MKLKHSTRARDFSPCSQDTEMMNVQEMHFGLNFSLLVTMRLVKSHYAQEPY